MSTDILIRFGLTVKEVLVYTRALALGSCPASILAKRSSLPRPTVYAVLERLRAKGLMSAVYKKDVLFFTPADPEVFLRQAEHDLRCMRERAEKVAELLPLLRTQRFSSAHENRVRFLEGKHGLQTIFSDATKASSVRMFGDVSFLIQHFAPYFSLFLQACLERRFSLHCILPLQEGISADARLLRVARVKYVPTLHTLFDGNFLLYGRNIALITFREDIATGVIIESAELISMFSFIFDFIWNQVE